jgi:hypothetical protein
MTAAEALREILARARAICDGERIVGGPRAVAWDVGSIASRFLGIEWPGPKPQELETWRPEEKLLPPPGRKRRWQKPGKLP